MKNNDYDKKIDNGLKKKELEEKYGASFSKDRGCFKLKPSEYGGWDIYHITMPGLTI